jgi:Transposase IS200 like
MVETIGFDLLHLHMVMSIPPKYSIANILGELKSQSASRRRIRFSCLSKVYRNENIVWSPGCSVNSVGVDEETIKRYVEHQGCQDSGRLLPQVLWTSRERILVNGFDVVGCQIPFASVDMQHMDWLVLTNEGTAGMHPPQKTFL